MPGKLGASTGWGGKQGQGLLQGASEEKQEGAQVGGVRADSTIRRWPGRRAEDEDLDQRQRPLTPSLAVRPGRP